MSQDIIKKITECGEFTEKLDSNSGMYVLNFKANSEHYNSNFQLCFSEPVIGYIKDEYPIIHFNSKPTNRLVYKNYFLEEIVENAGKGNQTFVYTVGSTKSNAEIAFVTRESVLEKSSIFKAKEKAEQKKSEDVSCDSEVDSQFDYEVVDWHEVKEAGSAEPKDQIEEANMVQLIHAEFNSEKVCKNPHCDYTQPTLHIEECTWGDIAELLGCSLESIE